MMRNLVRGDNKEGGVEGQRAEYNDAKRVTEVDERIQQGPDWNVDGISEDE